MVYFRRAMEVLILLAVGAAAIWALVWIAPGAVNAPANGKSFWDIVSAIGSASAAVVALWIATRDTRERRQFALTRASLAAAAVAPEVASASTIIVTLVRMVERQALFDRNTLASETMFTYLAQAKSFLAGVDERCLIDLVALPDQCAHRLSRAKTLLKHAESYLEFWKPYFDLDPSSGPVDLDQKRIVRNGQLDFVLPIFRELAELLTVASSVCNAAAKV